MKKIALIALALTVAAGPALAQEQRKASTLDELLQMVRDRTLQDRSELRRREKEFESARDRQKALLEEARKRRDAEEKRSQELEATFAENKETIAAKEQALRDKLGSLKELFGIFQQTAGDLIGVFNNSPVSAQYANRGEFLQEFAKKMGRSSQITTIEEIERMWFEMQREMTETGKISRFNAPVLLADGNEASRDVVRVGTFNVVFDDGDSAYINWDSETQKLTELARQPDDRHLSAAGNYVKASGDYAGFSLDPTGGSLLARLVTAPDLRERIEQGGLVGYLILGLGAIALVLALWRILALSLMSMKVAAQRRNIDQPDEGNPLGRVLNAYHQNRTVDSETLEMKLGEAILREMPSINRALTVLKIIAVVAPLMGLLGTVTGMINTFQAITLFGTGDPKTMAGGISQALVTTVLGLTVAIPTVFLHTIASVRARAVTHLLTEQSAGLVAEHMEKHGAGPSA